jgi:fatty-acyl-CoA synthase
VRTLHLPPLRDADDLAEIERVPLDERGLPASTWALLGEARVSAPEATANVWLPDPSDPASALTLSYSDLHDRVERTARAFAAIGVGRADAVSFASPNSSGLLIGLLAAEAAGIAAPINPLFDVPRVEELMRASGSRLLIAAGPEFDRERWERVRDAGSCVRAILALRPDGATAPPPALGARSGVDIQYLDEVVDTVTGNDFDAPRSGDIAAFFHTGGTTGAPKVAAHTHGNQVTMAWSIAAATGMTPESRALAGLPLFHVNALLVTALAPIVARTASVWPGPLGWRDPRLLTHAWRLVEHYGITTMSAVPTVYARLAAQSVDADISSLRTPIVGAAPLPRTVAEGFARATGVPLLEGYGLTEATCASTFTPAGRPQPGRVGQRLPYQRVAAARVDGHRVDLLPAGETGEIVIGGPTVFAGYVSRDADGARHLERPLSGGEWLRTGDLGVVHADQTLELRGRSKDLIIRGGHNIEPRVIEEAFTAHPAIADAAAVGRPDPLVGEVPVVYVTVTGEPEPTDAELFAWAVEHIDEPAARPTRIHVVPGIPVTAIGKIYKPELRRMATTDAAAAVLAAEGIDTAVESVLTDAGVEIVLPADADERAEAALLSLALPLRRNG